MIITDLFAELFYNDISLSIKHEGEEFKIEMRKELEDAVMVSTIRLPHKEYLSRTDDAASAAMEKCLDAIKKVTDVSPHSTSTTTL
jgi:hypothetical protein